MKMEYFVILVLVCVSLTQALPVGLNSTGPSEIFPYHADLDSNYRVYWKFNETHITFETHVNTNGYIGFGISPNGKMYPADVIIGWVKDKTAYFQDQHTTGHTKPIRDKSQDWTLLSASEVDNMTKLKFTRKLETCDDDDLPILDGTTRVIYSYHPDDPTDTNQLPYHGSERRGAKSLLLLDPPASDLDDTKDGKDMKIFDILARNYSVPASDTTYHCTTYMMPDYGTKHQMIKYEPIITPGNVKFVHHLVVYTCTQPMSADLAGLNYLCYQSRPPTLATCYSTVIAWATGGKEFVFPAHVGFPMGYGNEARFLLMEVHYDNPSLKSDIIDSSGIRIHLTPNVRKHEAGIMDIGAAVNQHMIIPPHSPGFLSTAYCPSECISKNLEKAGIDEIHVFANLLHSHLLGRGIAARVIRGGQELPPLAEDNNYDFDYQEMRTLRDEYTLKKGDSIIVECLYESKDKAAITFGGLDTRDEMCEVFAMYYPRTPLLFCNSDLKYNNVDKDIHYLINELDFSKPEDHKNFTDIVEASDVTIQCIDSTVWTDYVPTFYDKKQSELQPTKRYVKPNRCV